jgi:ornithine carbamoyltransferase
LFINLIKLFNRKKESGKVIIMNLKGRSFLTLLDFNKDEIRYMLDLAHALKKKKKDGIRGEELAGKNIVLIFDKSSTRTRCSFEVAAADEGAHVTYLLNSHMNKKESLEDSAKVFGRMYDAIEYRGFGQDIVENLARYSGVPVWNGLTDTDHPTQVLADFMTMEEHIDKPLSEMRLTFVGDLSDNVMYALMYGCAIMGMHFKAVGPEQTVCDPEMLAVAREKAQESGAVIEISHDPEDVKGSDVIYTDIWVSMGEDETLYPVRVEALTPFKVTRKMMKDTGNENCLFMHCLPAYHDFETSVARDMRDRLGLDIREVEDEVFRSDQSVVFDEAENRMHSIKAVMVATLGNHAQ